MDPLSISHCFVTPDRYDDWWWWRKDLRTGLSFTTVIIPQDVMYRVVPERERERISVCFDRSDFATSSLPIKIAAFSRHSPMQCGDTFHSPLFSMDDKKCGQVTLQIRSPSLNETLTVTIERDSSVRSLKELLQKFHPRKPPAADQRLIFSGRILDDADELEKVLEKVGRERMGEILDCVVKEIWVDIPCDRRTRIQRLHFILSWNLPLLHGQSLHVQKPSINRLYSMQPRLHRQRMLQR